MIFALTLSPSFLLSFFLLGWISLIIPSLLLEVQKKKIALSTNRSPITIIPCKETITVIHWPGWRIICNTFINNGLVTATTQHWPLSQQIQDGLWPFVRRRCIAVVLFSNTLRNLAVGSRGHIYIEKFNIKVSRRRRPFSLENITQVCFASLSEVTDTPWVTLRCLPCSVWFWIFLRGQRERERCCAHFSRIPSS